MSDTPMTDEAQFGTGRVSVDFARRLERELTEARDLLGDMAWELEYLVKQFDPSGKNHDWNDARKLIEKYKTLERPAREEESMSNTCPKCGAEYNGRPAPNQHDYWCGSTTWGDVDFYQSPECVRRERDQLVERIKRLENAGNEVVWWFCPKESSQLSSGQSVALKQWNAAKETKP